MWDQDTGQATCSCPTFWARFSDGRCYEEYTQGPCQLGDIVLMDRSTGVGYCGCNNTVPMYYHAETNQEQIKFIFLYNHVPETRSVNRKQEIGAIESYVLSTL